MIKKGRKQQKFRYEFRSGKYWFWKISKQRWKNIEFRTGMFP